MVDAALRLPVQSHQEVANVTDLGRGEGCNDSGQSNCSFMLSDLAKNQ